MPPKLPSFIIETSFMIWSLPLAMPRLLLVTYLKEWASRYEGNCMFVFIIQKHQQRIAKKIRTSDPTRLYMVYSSANANVKVIDFYVRWSWRQEL